VRKDRRFEGPLEIVLPFWLKSIQLSRELLDRVALLPEMLILERVRLRDEEGLIHLEPKFLRAS
jgi:hypothetical protein